MSDNTQNKDIEEKVNSPERRTLLKKAVYSAPAILILGVATPIKNAYAFSNPPGDPSSPDYDPDAPDRE